MSGNTTKVPDWLLERVALGELPLHDMKDARRRLREEPGGEARLETLRESDLEILRTYPADAMVESIRRRVKAVSAEEGFEKAKRRGRLAKGLLVGAPLAVAIAAAVVFVVASPALPPAPMGAGPEVTRVKGLAPHLFVYRKTANATERLDRGAKARARDLLQLSYVAAGAKYGAVLSVDGRGDVTLHFPGSPTSSAALSSHGETPLDHAYELDDAPGFERFFFVTSEQPFDVAAVLEEARALASSRDKVRVAPLDVTVGLRQSSVVLEKVQP
ncbi:MAG: ActD-like protein [Deltaproteobacteria bacterium]|nr:ActD-like protein [Deltaproteobacteria bacterium]